LKKEEIDILVDRILFAEGLTVANLPIDIERIVRYVYDIKIIEWDRLRDYNLYSVFVFDGNKNYIILRNGLVQVDRNILIAQELSHYLLSQKSKEINYTNTVKIIRCTLKSSVGYMTRAFLMPNYLIKRYETELLFSEASHQNTQKEIIDKFGFAERIKFALKRFDDIKKPCKIKTGSIKRIGFTFKDLFSKGKKKSCLKETASLKESLEKFKKYILANGINHED